MFSQLLGKPIQIQNQDCILVPDIIGSVPVSEQHEYVEIAKATNTCAAIQMREADIEGVRQDYPHLPVYGLWQVLLHSNCVDFNTTLQVVPLNTLAGYYIHADVGRILYSGNYEAGFFAADSSFRLNQAQQLQPPLSVLRVPKKPALLAKEILRIRRHHSKKTLLKIAAAVVGIAVLAIAADAGLQLMSQQEYNLLTAQDKKLTRLKKEYQTLAKNKMIKTPDQSQAIDRLAVVMHDLGALEFEKTITFKSKTVSAIAVSDENPAFYYEFLTATLRPDGRWQLTISLR